MSGKDLLERWLRDGFEAGDTSLVDDLFAEDFVGHDPVAPVRGREELRRQVTAFRGAFEDVTITRGPVLQNGDRVAVVVEFRGRHVGEIGGLRPSGRTMCLPGTVVFRVADGRLVEGWQIMDYTELMPPGASAIAHSEGWVERWKLSPRHAAVARLAMAGLTDEEIALHTKLSVQTVRTYLREVFERAGVGSRTELLSAARLPVG